MEVQSATASIKAALEAAKDLRTLAKRLADIEIETRALDVIEKLNDAREKAEDQRQENVALRHELDELLARKNIRSKIVARDGCYFFGSEPPPGQAPGPYCTACFDRDERLILMADLGNGHRPRFACPNCHPDAVKPRVKPSWGSISSR